MELCAPRGGMQSSRPHGTAEPPAQHAFPTKQLPHTHTHTHHDVSCRLTNGYVVTVDFDALIKLQQSHKLPDRVSAMCTTKVRHRRRPGCGCRAGAVTVRPLTVGVLLLWACRSSMSTCRTSPR